MARVEWALLCDLAYFDAYGHLCVIGAHTQCPVPMLVAGTHRITIAARVVGLRPRPDVVVSVSTPDGRRSATTWCERIEVEALGDDLLIRLGGVPVMPEGMYRLDVLVNGEERSAIDLPVQVVAHRVYPPAPSGDRYVGQWDSRGTNHAGLV
jgi:hypothetical protein